MQRRQFIQSAFLSGMMLNASGTVSAQNSPFGELRADPRKILEKKVRCRKCLKKAFRPVRKK